MIYPRPPLACALVAAAAGLASGPSGCGSEPGVALSLDQEHADPRGAPLNPSTQSINRYASVLRGIDRLSGIELDRDRMQASFALTATRSDHRVDLRNIDVHYLVPLLPYPRDGRFDAFDAANLMLGEHARNGVALSYQEENRLFGFFNASPGLFRTEEDYFVTDGALTPNPEARPLRFNVVNNCLRAGLWEFSASDSVGEMYHSWFEMPAEPYFDMIRAANGLDLTSDRLQAALDYRADLSDVPLRLDRLRVEREVLLSAQPFLAGHKAIGAYSSQDSRRKVQRRYFQITRGGNPTEAATFADLRAGDVFELMRFVPPGVYSASETQLVGYRPYWTRAEIKSVAPLTRYPGSTGDPAGTDYLEITLYESGEKSAIVIGNVPIDLLVAQEDFRIPAFGAGVLLPSQPIERRYLRLKDGPAPYYAYQTKKDAQDRWVLVNNHETGIEQAFLRPFERQGRLYLRVTLVSYERIVDLMEMEIPLQGPLVEEIRAATEAYQPPLYRVYEDTNLL